MRKPYIEIFSDTYSELQNNFKEQGFKIAEFLDKIVVWLIGLSTGAILIILSKIKELPFAGTCTVKVTLILLVASIVTGILGRILYAIALYWGYSFMAILSSKIKMLGLSKKPRELAGDETKENIYLLLQEDFNIDLPFILKNEDPLNSDIPLSDEKARKLYSYYSEIILTSIQDAYKDLTNIYVSTFGYKEEYLKKKALSSNRTKGILYRVFTYLSFSLYILSALLFGSAIFYLIMQYVKFSK
jgi:hypothetical protein